MLIIFFWRDSLQWARASSFTRFLDHTQRLTTVGKTVLDEWSARRRDLYLTTHNTRKRQTSTSPVGFEPTISTGERSQNYALDRAATGTGTCWSYNLPKYIQFPFLCPLLHGHLHITCSSCWMLSWGLFKTAENREKPRNSLLMVFDLQVLLAARQVAVPASEFWELK